MTKVSIKLVFFSVTLAPPGRSWVEPALPVFEQALDCAAFLGG